MNDITASENIKAFISTKGDMSVGIHPQFTYVDTFMSYEDLAGEINSVREEIRGRLIETFGWLYDDKVSVEFEFEGNNL
jgi:hypothetical protein